MFNISSVLIHASNVLEHASNMLKMLLKRYAVCSKVYSLLAHRDGITLNLWQKAMHRISEINDHIY